MKLDDVIKEKQSKLSNPYTSMVTRRKLLEIGWEVMSHPPYSSNLTPSDYH